MTAVAWASSLTCINDVGRGFINLHDGGCYVGLHLQIAGTEIRQSHILREVIRLLDYEETAADDIALVLPLFDRLVINGFYVPVSYAEGRALISLCQEAEDYWQQCNYANTSDTVFERLLGTPHVAIGSAVCWNQNNLRRRQELPVGLHEKPYRWVNRYVREKEYTS